MQAMRNAQIDKLTAAINGKTYSTSNCRKAINKLTNKNLFKGTTLTIEPKNLTYKMDTPPIPEPEPEPTTTQLTLFQEDQQQENINNTSLLQQQLQQQQETNPQTPASSSAYQQIISSPETQQQYNFVEPNEKDVEAVKDIAQIVFRKIAKLADDQTAEMNDHEGLKFGRACCILLGDGTGKLDPRKIAYATLGTSFAVRGDALAKAGKKISSDLMGMVKGGKSNA